MTESRYPRPLVNTSDIDSFVPVPYIVCLEIDGWRKSILIWARDSTAAQAQALQESVKPKGSIRAVYVQKSKSE